MSKFTTEEFKKKLDEIHSFPTNYMFKFIVLEHKQEEVTSLFESAKINIKPSSKGKYVSVTAELKMPSSDAVIDIYKKAHVIEGIIAL